jgi:membrane associated rhomboid family serine protease
MGIADRYYMRDTPAGFNWSATVVLIAVLVAAFLVQITALPRAFADEYLALSLDGLRRGFVWQLLTFQFLHGGWIHLALNCWAIYVFGRALEWVLGKSRLLTLYFCSGVAGGLLQMLGALVWPSHLGGAVVGASAGGFGLVAAFAALNPHQELTLLLFFVLPVKLRARSLLIICLALSGLGIALPNSVFGGDVAHAAHLGGLLAGLGWVKLGWHQDYLRLPWEGLFSRWGQWTPFHTRRRKRELVRAASVKEDRWPVSARERLEDLPPEEFISREVDPILDKISAHGIQSLTERERRILEAARKRMVRR